MIFALEKRADISVLMNYRAWLWHQLAEEARAAARQIKDEDLERFPLGLNRDSQGAGKGGVLGGDSVIGMRHDQALFGGFAGACG